MRLPLIAAAAIATGFSVAAFVPAAFAQTATTGPMSSTATNLAPSDTRSPISPRLPTPAVAPDSGPMQYLTVAKSALQRNRTGEAQSALEMAETRALDRSIPAGANPMDSRPMVKQITDALDALGHGNKARAQQIVDALIAGGANGTSTM